MKTILLVLIISSFAWTLVTGDYHHEKSKYKKPKEDGPINLADQDIEFRHLHKPFRMSKLNLVWSKAVHRLTETKLRSLYSELKIHDKEEIEWKQRRADSKPKDGLKEAELRKKLIGIMSSYDLLDYLPDTENDKKVNKHEQRHNEERYLNKRLFKDKRLNKLWEKVELSGFSTDEVAVLKQEFKHHEDKMDIYHNLLDDLSETAKETEKHENAVNEDELDVFNEIEIEDGRTVKIKSKDFAHKSNVLREKHKELRDSFSELEKKVTGNERSQEFSEPKVQGLWRLATNNNFTTDELASIKSELQHFEERLKKLKHLQVEQVILSDSSKKAGHNDKQGWEEKLDEKIKKHSRKVEKYQDYLEKKVLRHTEL